MSYSLIRAMFAGLIDYLGVQRDFILELGAFGLKPFVLKT